VRNAETVQRRKVKNKATRYTMPEDRRLKDKLGWVRHSTRRHRDLTGGSTTDVSEQRREVKKEADWNSGERKPAMERRRHLLGRGGGSG